MLLVFKPFTVGDYLEAQGHAGTVKEIQIFNTILKTPDNKTIIIPNGGLSTGSMVNYSTEATRRIDFTFGIGYEDDIDKAREVLLAAVKESEFVLDDPAPAVSVANLGDSSVDLAVRPWVKSAKYAPASHEVTERIKKALDHAGISIPFPQRDVHIVSGQG